MTVVNLFGGASAPPTITPAVVPVDVAAQDAVIERAASAAWEAITGPFVEEPWAAMAERARINQDIDPERWSDVEGLYAALRPIITVAGDQSGAVGSGLPNNAREIADRAHRWIEEAMQARKGLTPQQRRDLAAEHVAQAKGYLEDPNAPLWMTVVGRHAWHARILTAED